MAERTPKIVHVDAFFASAEQVLAPHLDGKLNPRHPKELRLIGALGPGAPVEVGARLEKLLRRIFT